MPVGMWVMRTAESVVLTDCPPGPLERYTSIRSSSVGISMSSSATASSIGITSSERERGVPPLLRVERADAHQTVHAALGGQQAVDVRAADRERGGLDPRLVAVLDLVDLGVEAVRSAHRVYMRSSISAQSWLSVPPAPALIVAIASDASYGPGEQRASSSFQLAPSRRATRPAPAHLGVGLLGQELVQAMASSTLRCMVVEVDLGLQARELRGDLRGAGGSSQSDGSEACARARRAARACRRRQRNSFAAETRSEIFARRSV